MVFLAFVFEIQALKFLTIFYFCPIRSIFHLWWWNFRANIFFRNCSIWHIFSTFYVQRYRFSLKEICELHRYSMSVITLTTSQKHRIMKECHVKNLYFECEQFENPWINLLELCFVSLKELTIIAKPPCIHNCIIFIHNLMLFETISVIF